MVEIRENVQVMLTRDMKLYKIAGLIWEALKLRKSEKYTINYDGENKYVLLHSLKVVRYPDSSTYIYDVSGDREIMVRNVHLLSMLFKEIWEMDGSCFVGIPIDLMKMKHKPY